DPSCALSSSMLRRRTSAPPTRRSLPELRVTFRVSVCISSSTRFRCASCCCPSVNWLVASLQESLGDTRAVLGGIPSCNLSASALWPILLVELLVEDHGQAGRGRFRDRDQDPHHLDAVGSRDGSCFTSEACMDEV